MLTSRRRILSTAAALPLFSIGSARAAEFNYRLAHDLPPAHPLSVRVAEACKRILTQTNGRVSIKVFADSVLGSDLATLDMIRAGKVEFFAVPGLILSSVVPSASINGVGFAFSSYPQVWAAMDGKLGGFIREEVRKFGMVAVGRCLNNGFRQSTTISKPIVSPSDFKGVKLRVPASPLSTSLFRALGAVPTAMNLDLVYAALQTRTVEGQETPLALMQASKFYEVQTYCSLTNHMWDGYWMLANDAVWAGLPAPLRETIERELDRAAMEERHDLSLLDPQMRGDIAMTGMEINAVDTGLFRRALQDAGFYSEWRTKYGPTAWKLLEEAAGISL